LLQKIVASQKNQHIASHVATIFCNHLAKLLQKMIATLALPRWVYLNTRIESITAMRLLYRWMLCSFVEYLQDGFTKHTCVMTAMRLLSRWMLCSFVEYLQDGVTMTAMRLLSRWMLCFFVEYLQDGLTKHTSRRQLTPNFGRIFGPRAWATLSSFGCNLPGPGVIVPKNRQFLGPRYVV
jgi:hypothetical protein